MRLNSGEDNGVRLAGRTSQSTARIARTARWVLAYRCLVWSALREVIDRQLVVIDRSRKY
jgi:hypothetical protein